MRTLLSSLSLTLLVTACGGPPPPPMQPPVVIPPSTTTNTTNTGSTSQNALGPCTGNAGAACGNGKGVCVGATNGGTSQCLAVAPQTGCPRGSFSAEYLDGKRVCLDLCVKASDCGAGLFCNSTVMSDESGTSRQVSVCMPGGAKKPGAACISNSTCGTDPDLECIIPTSASVGICTKSCTSEAQCGGAACSQGGNVAICIARCGANGTCETGLSCRNGLCIPQAGGSNNNSPGSSTYPTPGFGALGGSCSDNNDCEGRYACLTSRPGGLCTGTCQSDSECGTGACVDQQNGVKVCLARCSTPGSQSNCRSGYQCRALSGSSSGYCL